MKILNLDKKATEIIRDKLNFGLLDIVYQICTRLSVKLNKKYNFHKEEEYKKEILLNFINIDNVLKKDLKQRKEEIFVLQEKINNLSKEAIPYLACLNYCDLISSIVSDYYILKEIALDGEDFSIEETIEEVCSYIDFKEKEGNLENASMILSSIPYSMAKENYSDYIYKSFEHLFKGNNKGMALNNIRTLKFKFYPFNEINDGKIKNRLEEITNLNFEERSLEELLAILKELDSISKEYAEIVGDISVIYGALIEILAVFKFSTNKEYLFNKDFILKDIFYSTKEMIEKNNFEIMSETIKDNCEEKIEEIIERLDEEEYKLNKIIENTPYEELLDTVKTALELDKYSGIDFEDNIIFNSDYIENNEKVDTKFIEEMADEFVDYINKLGFSNKLLKMFKQHFFECIPYPFKGSFLKEYVKGVLSNLSNEMGILTADKLFPIIDVDGFLETLDEEFNRQYGDLV